VDKYAAEHSATLLRGGVFLDLRAIELDVSSRRSSNTAIQEGVSRNGRLDLVVHNAGHMVCGLAEASTPEAICRAV
jgi:NADP-dependent 3-hydroxy acid dehydrogenase YdfG